MTGAWTFTAGLKVGGLCWAFKGRGGSPHPQQRHGEKEGRFAVRGDYRADSLCQTPPCPVFNNRLGREGGRTTLGVWLPRHGRRGAVYRRGSRGPRSPSPGQAELQAGAILALSGFPAGKGCWEGRGSPTGLPELGLWAPQGTPRSLEP